jgi:DNA gyrase subunit A
MSGHNDGEPISGDLAAIVAGASVMVGSLRERAHIECALIAAIDQNERVRQVIVASESALAAESALMTMMGIDQVQARAILDMQQRKLATREREQLGADYDAIIEQIGEYEAIIASPELLQKIAGTDRGTYLLKRGQTALD